MQISALAGLHIRLQAGDEIGKALDALLTGERAHGDGVVLRFLVAEHEHIRDLLALRLADLVADLLVAQVRLDAQACLLQASATCLA